MSAARPAGGYTSEAVSRLLHAAKPIGRLTGVLLGLGGVAIAMAFDVSLGAQVPATPVYVFGPIIAAWCAQRRDGILVSAVAAAGSVALQSLAGDLTATLLATIVTAVVRFSAFATIALLVSEVRTSTERLEVLSMRDDLTGLLNRRALLERLDEEIARARRKGTALSLVYADVDSFKTVNDRFGHGVGDDFLMRVAEGLEGTLRPTDIAARMGGDEFVVLLPETDEAGTAAIVGRLAEKLEPLEETFGAGLSLGCRTFLTAPESSETAINAADEAMYETKRRRKAALHGDRRGLSPVAPGSAPRRSTT